MSARVCRPVAGVFPIQKDIPQAGDQPPLRAEVRIFLDELQICLASVGRSVQRHSHGLRCWNALGFCEAVAIPCQKKVGKRLRLAVIRLRTPWGIPEVKPPGRKDMDECNSHTLLGAVIRERPERAPFVGSRITLYLEDGEEYARLARLAALALLNHGEALGPYRGLVAGNPFSKPADRRDSPWQAPEFQALATWMEYSGHRPAGTRAYLVHPRKKRPKPKPGGPRWGPVFMHTDHMVEHVSAGLGLLIDMSFVLFTKRRPDRVLASQMNRLEWRALDGSPFLGAWTAGGRSGLRYRMFIPDYAAEPGLVLRLMPGILDRIVWADRYLRARPAKPSVA
jgi:hypothetical protein